MLTNRGAWTNVVGVARTLLAVSTLVTLVCNRASTLFRPVGGDLQSPVCDGVRRAGVFCIATGAHLEVARWLCVGVLLLVASGWRPRVTGLAHWWVSFSLASSAATIDGGDQIAAILALILVPVTLTDDRKWHWSARKAESSTVEGYKRDTASVALTVARIQMSVIYLHAAVGKAFAEQWADGTALYYWLTSRDFGAPHWLGTLLHPFLLNGVTVSCMTWGVIAVELFLAAGLVASPRHWRTLLWLGIALHAGILVIHGLVSFVLTMFAGLILYLRPVNKSFDLRMPTWTWPRIPQLVLSKEAP